MNELKDDLRVLSEVAPKWVSVPRETGEPKGVINRTLGGFKIIDEVNEHKKLYTKKNRNRSVCDSCLSYFVFIYQLSTYFITPS